MKASRRQVHCHCHNEYRNCTVAELCASTGLLHGNAEAVSLRTEASLQPFPMLSTERSKRM